MGAQRAGAMGVGTPQREIHAGGDIGGAPAGVAVSADGCARAVMGAVGVRAAGDDVAFVDVGVHVDEAGQRHTLLQVDGYRFGRDRDRAGRGDGGDAAAGDVDVAGDEPVARAQGHVAGQQVGRDARVGKADGCCGWNDGEGLSHAVWVAPGDPSKTSLTDCAPRRIRFAGLGRVACGVR